MVKTKAQTQVKLTSSDSPKFSKHSSPSTPKKNSDLLEYKIRLLDSEQKSLEISISKNDNGQVLFDKVCDKLGGIVERDYFGLRYMDKNNQRQWLDLGRNVKKQMTGSHSSALSFRVKHYPGNPIADFHQEISLYLLYLQIRRDIVQGRLLCPLNELYTMGGLILQSEYGDAPDDEGEPNGTVSEEDYKFYFKDFKVVFNQTREIESEMIAHHRMYRGLTAKDAEIEIIKIASRLPTYGVDPFPVKIITKEKTPKKSESSKNKDGLSAVTAGSENNGADAQSTKSAPTSPTNSVYLGLRHTGLTTYVGLQPSETIEWDSIEHLACDGKDFTVYIKPTTSKESCEIINAKTTQEEEKRDSKSANSSTPQSEEECKTEEPAGDEKSGKSKKKNKSEKTKEKVKKEKPEKAPKSPTKSRAKQAKPRVVTFRCDTKAAALALWMWTVDRQNFFTLKQASDAKLTKSTHGLFRRSHSYRFVGKSQMELKSIANSMETFPQPSFERVSSLRRPRSGNFDQFNVRASLPARIRTAEDGFYPTADPVKRPTLPTTDAEQPSATTPTEFINMANGLRGASGSETNPPIKADAANDSVTVVPVSVNPVASAASANPQSTDVDEVRQRTNHISEPADRDSEYFRAISEIDKAIDSIQGSSNKKVKTLPNGEVPSHENKASSSGGHSARSVQSESIYSNSVRIALEAAALIGVVCIGVMIAALETSPGGPGKQGNAWTELAMNLRGQPIVASFNEYIYAPLRGFFIGGGH